MLITKYFIFLHFPRTGGMFFRRACREHLPKDWLIGEPEGAHLTYRDVPVKYAKLPMICFIRNPWDWYVSWYELTTQLGGRKKGQQRPTKPTHFWNTLFGGGRNDFRQTVVNACTRNVGSRGWEIAMQEWDVDFFSATYYLMSGHLPRRPGGNSPLHAFLPPDRQVDVGRYESLRQDFVDFLSRHEIPAPQAFVDVIREAPPRHASVRRPYREYYDEELRDLVAYKARTVIADYGYTF